MSSTKNSVVSVNSIVNIWIVFPLIFRGGLCNTLLTGLSGELTTPKYSSMYPPLLSCVWEIEVPAGYHIGLAFVDRYYIEESENCTKDFVMVYNHGQKKDDKTVFEVGYPPKQKFCGREHPPVFNSTYRWMTVRFQSDADKAGEGFKAHWTAICGGVYTDPEGTILSPNYPESYEENSNCNYTIFAPGKIISLEFVRLDLEPAGPGGCSSHNLTIYAFESSFSNELTAHEVYCGSKLPPKQNFKSMVSIVLRSDDFVQTKGFVIKYQTQGCGGIIMEAPATITSMQQGIDSTIVSKCQWNITAPPGQVVLVQFTKLQLQKSPFCFINSVKLYNGLDPFNYTSEIGQICDEGNENLRVIKSTSNKMAIVFRGYISESIGFEANVFFSLGEQKGCGGKKRLVAGPKNSSVPLDLEFSPNDTSLPLSCEWHIFSPFDETIKLTFNALTFSSCDSTNGSSSQSCDCNTLSVYDGDTVLDENLIKTVCNASTIPMPLISSGNMLVLVYTMTQPSSVKPRLSFKVEGKPSICGPLHQKVTNQTSVLTSPGWPQPYQQNVRCVWHLATAQTNSYIDIHITDLDIAPSPLCKNDYLQLSEDHVNTSPPTYCESKPNDVSITDYYSKTSTLKVAFVSSGIQNSNLVPGAVKVHKGFRLEFRESGCNRNYTRDYGQFQLDQQGGFDCTIIIRSTKRNATLSLYFSLYLMYQRHDLSCADHNMMIYDGADASSKLLRTVCQSESLPNPIFATGSSLKLVFHSKKDASNIAMLTLDLTYTSSTYGRGCGGYFYSSTGTFSSPLYPEVTRNESLCRWTVNVPEGNIMMLSFVDFDLGPPSTCETNYLTLYDLSPTTNEEIFARKYCGHDKPMPYMSVGNKLIVESKFNANRAGPGWLINFLAVKKTSAVKGGVDGVIFYKD